MEAQSVEKQENAMKPINNDTDVQDEIKIGGEILPANCRAFGRASALCQKTTTEIQECVLLIKTHQRNSLYD